MKVSYEVYGNYYFDDALSEDLELPVLEELSKCNSVSQMEDVIRDYSKEYWYDDIEYDVDFRVTFTDDEAKLLKAQVADYRGGDSKEYHMEIWAQAVRESRAKREAKT